jgi:hypothetical protein
MTALESIGYKSIRSAKIELGAIAAASQRGFRGLLRIRR